jgi:hypothetical protein
MEAEIAAEKKDLKIDMSYFEKLKDDASRLSRSSDRLTIS